mmetsp:Transcript_119959/g.208338  ORF Transcript_119959/g.208338 Transcript_119959/m.208338 type:complete len:311 (-) Transcript_119959:77-1009(-)
MAMQFMGLQMLVVVLTATLAAGTEASMRYRGLHRKTSSFLDRREEASFADTVVSAAVAASRDSPHQDSLEKAKATIRSMLSNMLSEHAAATDRKHFCDHEMATSKLKVKKLGLSLEKAKADLDKDQAELAELKDHISELHESIASSLRASQQDAELRAKEHAAHEAAKAAYKQTFATRTQATKDDAAAAGAPPGEFEKRVEAETAEVRKQMLYEREQQDLEVQRSRKTKEAQNGEHTVTKTEHKIFEASSDLRILEDELSAAKEYEAQLKRQCVVQPEPYKERRQRREQHIANLKDALDILSGDSVPTGY